MTNQRFRLFASLSLVLCFVASAVATAGEPAAQGGKKPAWKVSGELEEACSCDAACPCWFASKPTRMNCSGGESIFIDKGSYGNVKLDGLAMASMGQSPEGMTMMESFGNWNFGYLYIDERANPEQRKALEEIAGIIFGPAAPPDKMKVQYVRITREINGKEHKVTLGNYGSFSGHLVDGGLGGPSKIVNSTGADPLHRSYLQGRTTRQTYTDAGQKWDWSGTNYMFDNFDVNSEEYAKYAAGLAQKMEAMKKK